MDTIPSTSGVYKITCTANKKIYIGSATNLRKRKNEHFNGLRQNIHHNPKMQRAWNKYGEQAFTFEVLELVLPMSLTAREQYWFSKLKPFGHKGFNISPTAGSTLGKQFSPEAREKMAKSKIGYRPSPEAMEAARQTNLGNTYRSGKKISPEHIEKIRQSTIGRKQSPEEIEKHRQANLGRKHTPETREKIRQAKLGKPGRKHSPEELEKMRQSMLAYHVQKRGAV